MALWPKQNTHTSNVSSEPNADVTLVSAAILGSPAVAEEVVNGVVTVIGVAEVRAAAAVYQCNYDIDAAGQLTSRGYADYRGDLWEYRQHVQRDDDHYASLLLFMLRSLSTSSRTTLETKPVYLPLKLATDTFALWELVDAVYIHGSIAFQAPPYEGASFYQAGLFA